MDGKFIENKEIFYKTYIFIMCGSYSDIETYDCGSEKGNEKIIEIYKIQQQISV